MSAAEFEASKFSLAEELKPIQKVASGVVYDYDGGFGREKVIDYMLDPLLLNLLKERKECKP